MTEKEREQILKMIEGGKISAEEGLKLMQVLDKDAPEDVQPEPSVVDTPSTEYKAEPSGMDADPKIARIKSIASRFWQVPLWIGVAIIVLSAAGMYALIQAGHMNFWFYCLVGPLLLGVLVAAAASGSRRARWIFVDVQQKPGERPGRIFLGFPLPLKFAAWFFRTFKSWIPAMDEKLKHTNVDDILEIIESGLSSDTPLVVNVDEGEEGERVKVYIG